MNLKILLALALSCTFCEGQSVLTTPADQTESVSVPATANETGAPAAPNQTPRQTRRNTYIDPFAPGSNAPAASAPGTFQAQSRFAGPIRTKSDFERFAEDATGRRLPVFGRQLFDEVPTTFSPVEHVPVPTDYVLGPGDELLIRAWGKIDLDSRVTVDRNGQIYLPKIGTLNVAGLRYDQVEAYLHSSISALFKDFELNVALGQLRSIQIFVLGNARQPGAYTVSSLSTLVNALFASGGPSATGTMRHIQLRRGNRVLTEFDIYALAEKGDKSHDVQLLPGDVIYIPPIGPQIAITGSVNEPGIYELNGETTVDAALEGAGGLTSLAGTERVLLERIDNHTARSVEEFSLNSLGLQRQLKDGDLLRVNPVSPRFENAVTLRGNVAQPGRYVWKEGMRVSDLIPSRSFLITRDYWNRENHLVPRMADHGFGSPRIDRYGNREIEQPSDDPSYDRGNDAGYQNRTQRIGQDGNQRMDQPDQPQSDEFGSKLTSRNETPRIDQYGNPRADQAETQPTPMIDTIGKNSAEVNWEYAVIERLDDHDLSTRLIPFRLASAIDEPTSTDNQLLQAGDIVTIFSRADLDLPMAKHASFVRVGGEVNAPGVYRVSPNDTLRDVVQRAGGLTPHSYLYASLFTRASTRHAQEEQLRQSADEMQRELISRYANATPQAGQTGADQQAQLAMQQAALARLTSIKPTGRVVLEMKPESATIADIPDFPLEDGDTFYIPPRLSTVQVEGAVYNANAFRDEPGKRLIAYLNDAGGATREADQKRIFVIRADGSVVSRQSRGNHSHGSFENLKLLPGDAIVVPEKIRVSSKMSDIIQATQLASQTALTAAALSVIK